MHTLHSDTPVLCSRFIDLQPVNFPANTTVAFAVNSTGFIRLSNGTLDYETVPVYTVIVTVTDVHPSASPLPALLPSNQTVQALVTISLIDDNEPTTLMVPTRVQVPEGSPVGTPIEGDFFVFDVDNQELNMSAIDRGVANPADGFFR